MVLHCSSVSLDAKAVIKESEESKGGRKAYGVKQSKRVFLPVRKVSWALCVEGVCI